MALQRQQIGFSALLFEECHLAVVNDSSYRKPELICFYASPGFVSGDKRFVSKIGDGFGWPVCSTQLVSFPRVLHLMLIEKL